MSHQTWRSGGNHLAVISIRLVIKTCSYDLFMRVLLTQACLLKNELVVVMASRLY